MPDSSSQNQILSATSESSGIEQLPDKQESLSNKQQPSSDRPVGLKKSVLGPLDVLAQSIANIAPTASPTVVIPLVFLAAGEGAWAAYLFALVAILLVVANINEFAKRSASAGNIYRYVSLGLGSSVGVAVAWALLIAYVGTASAVTTGFTNYVNVLFQTITGNQNGLPPTVLALVVVISVFVAWYVAYRDVQLSARLMLTLEIISLVLIGIVVIGTILSNPLNLEVLTLKGVTGSRLKTGLVLAIFSFVGFESATSLGTEAKEPLRNIPRALLRSALFVGVFFIFSAYAETVGFAGREVGLADSSSPIQDLAGFLGLGWLSTPITLVAILSFFACTLASLTAGARVIYQVALHGVFPKALGRVHVNNQTPHFALSISALIAVFPAALLTLFGVDPFTIYGWVGTTATLAFIVSYATVSVAAPVYLWRIGALRLRHILISLAAVLLQLVAFTASVYPLPEGADAWPVIAFLVLFGGGILYGAIILRSRRQSGLSEFIQTTAAQKELVVEHE